MSRNDAYTTVNLLDFPYQKIIINSIDLSRQTNANIPQQFNFTGKLEEDDGGTMFSIAEKQQKNNSKFFFRFINCNRILYIMEHQKKLNFLKEANDSKFVTRKWNNVNDDSHTNYGVENDEYNTEVLKSNFCDYNDAYILV